MNTDGVILWHPDKQLPTSTKIGDIKSELLDGVVYAYYCPRDNKTTSYTLYQYVHPTKGIQKKGNARLTLRKDMDLSQGLVVKCKIVRDDKNKEKIENLRIERVPVDEEI